MYPEFSFGTALTYFTTAPGPRGFLWKFMLSYAVFLTLCCVVTFVVAFVAEESGGISPIFPAIAALIIGPVFLIFWASHEGAIQRRLVRGDGFALRLGSDELRLIGVAVLNAILLTITAFAAGIAAYALSMVFAATGSGTLLVLGSLIDVVLVMLAVVGVAAKLSAAAALSVRDGKIDLAESFRVTGGRFWRIIGAQILLYLGFYICLIVFIAIISVSGVALGYSASAFGILEDGGGIGEIFGLVAMILLLLGVFAFGGLYQLMIAGPGALAAVNDASWEGAADAQAEVFS